MEPMTELRKLMLVEEIGSLSLLPLENRGGAKSNSFAMLGSQLGIGNLSVAMREEERSRAKEQ